MTPLDKSLRREVSVGGKPFTLTIDPVGLKLTGKGRRNGVALTWENLVNGDAELSAALRASLTDER